MGRYAIEPDNATKAAKARGSNLRVHFKVSHCYNIFYLSTNNRDSDNVGYASEKSIQVKHCKQIFHRLMMFSI